VERHNGEVRAIVNKSDAFDLFLPGKFYRLNVKAGYADCADYQFTITDPEKPNYPLNPTDTFFDDELPSGYAGVTYGNHRREYAFDNFYIGDGR